ncbi:serine hydrolase domain-containing protein [Sandaracinobacter neustonicus]|nr:serine hydrolase domain-containing protein [Sandaracinobacter neustonicus]
MRIAAACLLLALAAPAAADPAAVGPAALSRALDAELASSLQADPSLPGIVATVSAPRLGLQWSGAVGQAADGAPLTPAHALRLASVTKVYTAATVMRLAEQGRLDLFKPIAPLLSDKTRSLLEAGGYRPDSITLHQLLTHTSGIYDYATSPAFVAAVQADLSHRWSREEHIALAMTAGAPVGAPGERFHYSDTGYVILGEIIERTTGRPLGQAMAHELGFRRLGLTQTHFERLDPTPGGQKRARQLFGSIDVATIDPSMDLWGGGGLISTTPEVATFMRALLLGQLFRKPGTLAASLLTPTSLPAKRPPHSALMEPGSTGREYCLRHAGYWGLVAIYCPASDTSIVVSWNQVQPGPTTQENGRLKLADRLAEIVQD